MEAENTTAFVFFFLNSNHEQFTFQLSLITIH